MNNFNDDFDDNVIGSHSINWDSVYAWLPQNQWELVAILDETIAFKDKNENIPSELITSLHSQAIMNLQNRGRKEIIPQDSSDEVDVMIRNRKREVAIGLNHLEIFWDDHGNTFFEQKKKPFTGGWKYKRDPA